MDLYREDYYAWTWAQAGALRRLAEMRPNIDVDWANLIEEVESLGRSERDAVRSQLRRLIEHCLKLRYATATDPRRGWLNSIDDARAELGDKLTRSLERDVRPELDRLYRQVSPKLKRDLEAYGEIEAGGALPPSCPFTFDQLLDEGWYPESPSD